MHRPSSRQSTYSSSSNTGGSTRQSSVNGTASTTATQRAREKQAEWAGFLALAEQTGQLQAHLDSLKDRTDLLQDGGIAIAKIMENWQNVFRATHIALGGLQCSAVQ